MRKSLAEKYRRYDDFGLCGGMSIVLTMSSSLVRVFSVETSWSSFFRNSCIIFIFVVTVPLTLMFGHFMDNGLLPVRSLKERVVASIVILAMLVVEACLILWMW